MLVYGLSSFMFQIILAILLQPYFGDFDLVQTLLALNFSFNTNFKLNPTVHILLQKTA